MDGTCSTPTTRACWLCGVWRLAGRGCSHLTPTIRPSGPRWPSMDARSRSSTGDRTNAIIHRLAYTAARGGDVVAIAELHRYLRGRDPQELLQELQAGVVDGGKPPAPVFPTEVEALEWMLGQSGPTDVVAITALAQRPEIFAYLRERGGMPAGPEEIKRLVRRARA